MLDGQLNLKARISGVILAGGENKRFGGLTKSNIIIGGNTIISRIVSIVEDIFSEIIIVTDRPADFRDYERFLIIKDHYSKLGPLGGVHSAIRASSFDGIFVFAGDMPFLSSDIINHMISRFQCSRSEIMVPKTGSFTEPLHAIYRRSVLRSLEKFIEDGKSRAIRDFISLSDTDYIDFEASEENLKAFTNINSRSDIENLPDDLYI